MTHETSPSAAAAERMTISFWLWNYFYAIEPGDYFHDLPRCFRELRERGFNTVRVDAGTGLCFTAAGEPRGELALHEPFPGYSTLRQMAPRAGAASTEARRVDVLAKVVELLTLAGQHRTRVIFSSWFYLHTFWFVDDALAEEFFAVPPEERFMRFARDLNRLLQVVKARGLQGQIACVEIMNECDGLVSLWGLQRPGDDEAARRRTSQEFRRWHEEALAFLQARHPDLCFAVDTCSAHVNHELLPRNAQAWNYHNYFAWDVYADVLEAPVFSRDFDFSRAAEHAEVGRFLRTPPASMDDLRARHSLLQYVAPDWPVRTWLYNSLDPQALPELERRLAARLDEQMAVYRQRIDNALRQAQETRAALFPEIPLLVGEGVTYCAHPDMRWEEQSDAYWALVAYATRRLRDASYWGCVPRTNSGPEDPVWREYPHSLRQAAGLFLDNDG